MVKQTECKVKMTRVIEAVATVPNVPTDQVTSYRIRNKRSQIELKKIYVL